MEIEWLLEGWRSKVTGLRSEEAKWNPVIAKLPGTEHSAWAIHYLSSLGNSLEDKHVTQSSLYPNERTRAKASCCLSICSEKSTSPPLCWLCKEMWLKMGGPAQSLWTHWVQQQGHRGTSLPIHVIARPGPAQLTRGDERFGVCRPVCDGLWVRSTHTEHLLCAPTRQFPVSRVRAPFLRALIFLTLPDLWIPPTHLCPLSSGYGPY